MTHPAPFTTLISPEQLMALQRSGAPLAVLDASFDLMQPDAGEAMFASGHIPGARHIHLDQHLSDKSGSGNAASGGRHPLPAREAFARWLSQNGISNDTQVVVYDRNGNNYCGRAWWMLKWLGHDAVAVLDGGWAAWQAAGGETSTDVPAAPTPTRFAVKPSLVPLVDTSTVHSRLGHAAQTVVDARGAPRFRGEVEPIDPVAGHIPGALNRPFTDNLGPDGRFKSADALRAEFAALLSGRDPTSVVMHCGSGVSAVPNVLAMQLAGLPTPALYAGSWSEWCTTPGMPVEKG